MLAFYQEDMQQIISDKDLYERKKLYRGKKTLSNDLT